MSMYPKMQKEMERNSKYGMEPLPTDPRAEQLYPGMGQSEKVLGAVDKLRDRDWEVLNDKIRNNEPASQEEIAALLERVPYFNTDDPVLLQQEIQRNRQANQMYCRTRTLTLEEVKKAKQYVITDSITPENRKQLERAADRWREEKGSWAGWEEKRLEMIQEIVEGKEPIADPNKEVIKEALSELISEYMGK